MIDRRGFFKIIAAAGAVAAMPSMFLAEPEAQILEGQRWIGNVREQTQAGENEFGDHGWFVRYDILICSPQTRMVEQIGADAWIDDLSQLQMAREPCIALLQQYMQHYGWRVEDMIPFESGMKVGQLVLS